MANEITITGSQLRVVKGGVDALINLASLSLDLTGSKAELLTQSVTTSAVALNLSTLGSAGVIAFKNLDATNYVELMTATGGTVFAKVRPGKWAIFEYGDAITAPAAKANTGTCLCQFLLIEK